MPAFAYTRAHDRATRAAVWLMLAVLCALALHHALPHEPSPDADPCLLCMLLASVALFIGQSVFLNTLPARPLFPRAASMPHSDPALWSVWTRRGPPSFL
jgi:hypothetical protein